MKEWTLIWVNDNLEINYTKFDLEEDLIKELHFLFEGVEFSAETHALIIHEGKIFIPTLQETTEENFVLEEAK